MMRWAARSRARKCECGGCDERADRKIGLERPRKADGNDDARARLGKRPRECERCGLGPDAGFECVEVGVGCAPGEHPEAAGRRDRPAPLKVTGEVQGFAGESVKDERATVQLICHINIFRLSPNLLSVPRAADVS